ncbi:MAG: ATP-binding protein [Bacteroidales bacterium]|nr:ATP-binding protein [Bacteroidales bacterium]
MKIMPTWDSFRAKYPSEEIQRARFEDLARALFCHRFDIKYGIFQYVNHAGNETNTVCVGDEVIGFQAKYFKDEIDDQNIIHSITKAKSRNPEQTKIIIFTNLTFGNPPKGQQMTSKQRKIEDAAVANDLTLEWSMDTMILDQVAPSDWIYDVFFGTEPNLMTFLNEEKDNTARILQPIKSQIIHNNHEIKVNRNLQIETIKNAINAHNHIILHGEGGCGKTAIIKDIYNEIGIDIAFCIRKAQSLKGLSLNEIFRLTNNYSAKHFVNLFKDTEYKVFVIDSAERLQEIEDQTTLFNLVNLLIENDWSIVFTVRNNYLSDLCYELEAINPVNFQCVSVDNILEKELGEYAINNQIVLPENSFFRERLCNLFYLNLYIRYYDNVSAKSSYNQFIDFVWVEKITSRLKLNGINFKRENCFKELIKDRIMSGAFFLNYDKLDGEALQALVRDEIIGESNNGVFITHDIYEEWGVLKFIDNCWRRRQNVLDFFSNLGTTFLVRRTFRQWLTDNIDKSKDCISEILELITNDIVESIWRDEIVVAILLSTYCEAFLQDIESKLVEKDSSLLKRLTYLLLIACKRYDRTVNVKGEEYHIYMPYGQGWSAFINWIYAHKDHDISIPNKVNIIYEWTLYNKVGDTTRYAGLIALDILSQTENGVRIYDSSLKERLCQVICNSANVMKEELSMLLDKINENKWVKHNDPYNALSLYILTRPKYAQNLIFSVPGKVLDLAKLYWISEENKEDDDVYRHRSTIDIEYQFGLRDFEFRNNYSPAGADQSPVYTLLCASPQSTVDFIVELINYSIEYYYTSANTLNDIDEIDVYHKGTVTKQLGSYYLWSIYRGAIHITIPCLLQSIHMALEKYLMELDKTNVGFVKTILDYILLKSRSVSLTAIVASIVMYNPDRYWRYALDLFRTKELFDYDSTRCMDENDHSWLIGMDAWSDQNIAQERSDSANLDFRKQNLEAICVRYQYFRTSNLTEEDSNYIVKEIHNIIDIHYERAKTFNPNERNLYEILLYRMDRRTHKPQVSEYNGQTCIELCPQLPQKLKEYSEKGIERGQKPMRFSFLHTWAYKKLRHEDSSVYVDYENNPSFIIKTIKELNEAISNGEELLPLDEYSKYAATGILVRDFYDELTDEELIYCVSIIDEMLEKYLSDSYSPQMSDGLECCVHALPTLFMKNSNVINKYGQLLIDILLDKTAIGQYKRICDYAIESIQEANLWSTHYEMMSSLLEDYVKAINIVDKLIQEEICNTRRNHIWGIPSYSKETIRTLVHDFISSTKSICINKSNDLERLEILLELIPADTKEPILQNYVKETLPYIANSLKEDRNNRYNRVIYLYKAFAHFVLNRDIEDIEGYILPLLSSVNGEKNTEYFLLEFIYTEDRLNKPENFWHVWKLLYKTVTERGVWYNGRVLGIYMLTDHMALDEGKWRSFNKGNTWLFDKLSIDCGREPIVMFSIAKSLNGLANDYIEQGIEWFYRIVHKYSAIELRDYQSNTIYYMEKLFSKYIRQNRMTIRSNNMKKQKIIDILSFMVERESVQAYMLREYLA